MPRSLQDQVHTDFSTDSRVWVGYHDQITGGYLTTGAAGGYVDWDNHLMREYNRKVNALSGEWTLTETDLILEPNDAGFRYTGTGDFKWDTYSLLFDGVDEYVNVGPSNALVTGTNVSISLWFKSDGGTSTEYLIQNCKASASTNISILINHSQTGNISGLHWNGSGHYYLHYAGNANDGNWHHVVFTLTSTAQVLYLDGVSVGTSSVAFPNAASTHPTTIATTHSVYGGHADEVAIWNSVLTAAQVRAIYNGGTPRSLDSYSPTAWWRMGDSVSGAGAVTADVEATDTRALHLPGVADNYASVPDAADLDGFGDFTLQVDDVTLPDWTPSAVVGLINKYNTTDAQRAYRCNVNTNGTLALVVTVDGSSQLTYTSSIATGVSDGSTASIRVLRTGSDIKFYVDSGSGFSQLGSTRSGVSTTIFNSTAQLQVGMDYNGNTSPLLGSLTRARVWNTATPDSSTPVLDMNFALANKGVSSFTATSGQTVTINTTAIDNPAVIRGATDGVLVNDPTFSTDTPFTNFKWDVYSVLFDGVDEYISTTADATLASKTYTFWAKSTRTAENVVFDHGAEDEGMFRLHSASFGAILFLHDNSGGGFCYRYWVETPGTPQDDGNWHHYVVVIHADITASKFYVDGVLQDVASTDATGSPSAYSSGIRIGRAGTNYFDGSLDEFAIFDGELSAAQVLAIYNGGVPADLSSLSPVTWWRMGDGDYYPILRDGVATDANALYLPGIAHNYASVPDAADLDGFGDFEVQVDDVTMPDWTPSGAEVTIVAKSDPSANESWLLRVDETGVIQLILSFDGATETTYSSTTDTGLANGATAGVGALRTGSDIKFFLDTGSGFSQLGGTVSGVSTALFAGTAPLEVGTSNKGLTDPLQGSIGRVRVWSDATQSTNVLDINFALADEGVSSFTATSEQTVTIHTTAIDDPAVIRAATDGVMTNMESSDIRADTP